jgi:hypothetical protein
VRFGTGQPPMASSRGVLRSPVAVLHGIVNDGMTDLHDLELDTPARVQRLALGRAAAELVDLCVRKGMVIPFIISMVSPNGVILVVRTGPEALVINPILEHYSEPIATYPVTITVVDRNGEASAWRLNADGLLTSTRH